MATNVANVQISVVIYRLAVALGSRHQTVRVSQ